MKRQVFSVEADRPVKEDRLWRCTTLTGKFPLEANLDRNFRKLWRNGKHPEAFLFAVNGFRKKPIKERSRKT